MLTPYTPAELRAWANIDLPPRCAVRKRLFTFGLWRPAWQRCRRNVARRPAAHEQSHGHGHDVNKPAAQRSADRTADSRSMTIGWLNAFSVRNKADAISDTITEKRLDVLAIQETWHTASDDACLRLITPTGYAIVDAARSTGPDGGVAVVFRQNVKCSRITIPECKTFESICVRLTTATGPVIIVNIYRPGSVQRPQPMFCEELSAVLETLVVHACPVVIGVDLNVHVQDTSNTTARHLADLLVSFDMVQHVVGPTHRCGNMLDLVITPSHCQLDSVTVSTHQVCCLTTRSSSVGFH